MTGHPGTDLRPVTGWPNYYVREDGSVWSYFPRPAFGRRRGWKRIRPSRRDGYAFVTLCRPGARRRVRVHRLVLEAFVGPCPPGLEARHLDGNGHNNARTNLAWGTHRENIADRTRHGRTARGERNGRAKLTPGAVLTMRREYRACEASYRDLALRFRVAERTVWDVVTGRKWKHLAA